MIKIVICDDEIHYQNKLEMELNEFAKDKYYLDIVKISTGIQMINYFKKENDIDIIFLDVHMPNIDGMEVAKELRKIGYRDEIIFYTHSKPEVFEAFDVDAFHYIIKEETDKIRRESIYQKAIDEARKQKENFISVACAGKSKIIPLAKIMYFKVSKSIVYIYLEDGSVVDFYTSLNKLQQALLDKYFVRIHSSVLVNMRYINELTKVDMTLLNGTTFKFGRVYKSNAINLISEYLKMRAVIEL